MINVAIVHSIDPNDNSASAPSIMYESAGANVPSSSSGDDYVWDVFYHRPATLSEWNDVANVGTVYVVHALVIVLELILAIEPGFPHRLGMVTILCLTLMKNWTKLMRTRMVNFLILFKNEAVHILFLAEEYYKNDYPEDEDSGRNLCLIITDRSPDSLKMNFMKAQITTT